MWLLFLLLIPLFLLIYAVWIAPRLLSIRALHLPLDSELGGLKIAQLSDIHLGKNPSPRYLNRVLSAVHAFKPDLIVLTGDFINYSQLTREEELRSFLKALQAPLGTLAVLGNHDYEKPIIIDEKSGEYTLLSGDRKAFKTGVKSLFCPPPINGQFSSSIQGLQPHPQLLQLLSDCSVKLLRNETTLINDKVAVTGAGEHSAKDINYDSLTDPQKRFHLLLCHNPDGIAAWKGPDFDLALAGHTHGGQINLPYLWRHFTLMEYPQYRSGVIREGSKTTYVSSGLGSSVPIRLFSRPELTLITLP